jgi:hypothetical protein
VCTYVFKPLTIGLHLLLLALLVALCMQHFDLVEEKELAPLSELIEQFLAGKMNSIR